MSFKLVLGFFRHGEKPFKNVNKCLNKNVVNTLIFQCRRCQSSTDTPSKDKLFLIYEGRLSKSIRRVKLFSLMTSMSGLFAQPAIMQRASELGATTSSIVILCSSVGFFTFITPLLLHYITKQYVTTVLYNSEEDSYIATTYSLFLRRKELQFKPGEGCLPDVPGMFSTISIRNKPLFLDIRHFSDVYHYKRIMGYDKPMDFKLSSDTSTSKQEH